MPPGKAEETAQALLRLQLRLASLSIAAQVDGADLGVADTALSHDPNNSVRKCILGLALTEERKRPPVNFALRSAEAAHLHHISQSFTRSEAVKYHDTFMQSRPSGPETYTCTMAAWVAGDHLFDESPKYAAESAKAREGMKRYLEWGGRVVLFADGLDPTTENEKAFREYFKTLGLPWVPSFGGRSHWDYNPDFDVKHPIEGCDIALRPSAVKHLGRTLTKPTVSEIVNMPFPMIQHMNPKVQGHHYYTKAWTLAFVEKKHRVYHATEGAVAALSGNPVDRDLCCPVAMAPVGKGWLAYIGDLDGCEETVSIALALAGCDLDPKYLP
jgi:hypothetical protein